MRQGRTVDDLSALRPVKAARQPHCIGPTTFVVLFGTDQESPNGTEHGGGLAAAKMSTKPSVCGRLVRSTLVRVAHRPIHPAGWLSLAPVMTGAQVRAPHSKPRHVIYVNPSEWETGLLYWYRYWGKFSRQLAKKVKPIPNRAQ